LSDYFLFFLLFSFYFTQGFNFVLDKLINFASVLSDKLQYRPSMRTIKLELLDKT